MASLPSDLLPGSNDPSVSPLDLAFNRTQEQSSGSLQLQSNCVKRNCSWSPSPKLTSSWWGKAIMSQNDVCPSSCCNREAGQRKPPSSSSWYPRNFSSFSVSLIFFVLTLFLLLWPDCFLYSTILPFLRSRRKMLKSLANLGNTVMVGEIQVGSEGIGSCCTEKWEGIN